MDWFLDPAVAEDARALRHEFAEYLARHGAPDSDFAAAELAFGEVVGNVSRHTTGPAWVSVDWRGEMPILCVYDLGPGFALDEAKLPADVHQEGGRGLYVVAHLTEELRVASRRAGGSKVVVTLPVRRRRETSIDPPRRHENALPSSEEASEDGTFHREAFLRALVVQLAWSVEVERGPDAAEAAVAQVGADVGGRMEDEYRRARGIVGRLRPEEMADLYVRLKRGIDGDFYVIEATEERIVLGNRRCPFGDVVRRSPALCRMTSSVFGGIAARNADQSVVQLEERIAVGDPECRVTVWLTTPPENIPGHRYSRPFAG